MVIVSRKFSIFYKLNLLSMASERNLTCDEISASYNEAIATSLAAITIPFTKYITPMYSNYYQIFNSILPGHP